MTMTTMRRARRGAATAALLGLAVAGFAVPATAAAAEPAIEVPTAPVVDGTTAWHYLDDGTDPARGDANLRVWTTTGYDDADWKQAPGSFGAKGGKLAAVGPHLPATLLNHYLDGTAAPTVPTYFFRTSFELEPGVAAEVGQLVGDLVYDDAVQVWVNGEKVAGFVDGRVTGTTNLEYAGDSNGDPLASTFTADGDVLVDGTNTVAIALFQDRASSSDIYLDVPKISLLPEAGTPGEPVAVPPTRVILTPTETPATSQSFSWLAGDVSHKSGQVQIRPAAGGETRTVDAYAAGTVNGNPLQHFSATVDGLTAATAYEYRVGLEGAWSGWTRFTTANPKATDFQFVYYGDAQIGLDSTWPNVVAQAEAKAPRSIGSVHAGDLINTSSNETEWLNWFKGMQTSAATTNVMAAPGNHEYSGDKLLKSWKANFEYPHNNPSTETIGELAELAVGESDVAKQYAAYFAHWTAFATETVYFTDYQGVRFITVNATRDTTFLTPDVLPSCTGVECPQTKVGELWTQFQAAWLDHVLTESPSKWNVVTFHQPVYSTSAGRDEPILRKYWVPVFQEHDIDLVMMGHDHTYARGYHNDDVTETAGITDGPVYIVSNSGAKHYELETPEKNVWTNNNATQVLRGAGVTTYQVVDVTKNQLVYRSYLAEKTANATTTLPVGAVYDEFTVTKLDDGRKWVTEAGVEPPVDPNPPVEPTPVDESLLTEANRGGVTAPASAEPGEEVELGLGADRAELAVNVWLHSEPQLLGTPTADAAGDVRATIPADAPEGEHRLVVQSSEGELIGWAPIRLAADPGTGPGPGEPGTGGPGTGQPGTGSGAGNGSGAAGNGLAHTGAEIQTALWLAGALLAAGAVIAVIAVRRRRRQAGDGPEA